MRKGHQRSLSKQRRKVGDRLWINESYAKIKADPGVPASTSPFTG